MKFKQFDRELEDFRNDVAKAHTTMRDVVPRYVAMMQALDSAFALYYGDMPTDDQEQMKAAFDKLTDTVALWTEKASNAVTTIITEQVRQVHAELCELQSYSRWLAAETDEEAIEGAVHLDIYIALTLIRERAIATGRQELATVQLVAVQQALIELRILSQKQIAALEVAEADAQMFRLELHGIKPN